MMTNVSLSSVRKIIHTIIFLSILCPPLLKAGTPRFPTLCIQVLSLAASLIVLYTFYKKRQWRIQLIQADMLVIAFLLTAAISSLMRVYRNDAQRCFLLILTYVLCYIYVILFFNRNDLERLMWGLVGLGVVESAIGLYQYFFLKEKRILGTFYNSNHLAAFFSCLSLFLIARILFNPDFRKNLMLKFVLLILLGMALFMTGSRGGLVGILAGGSVIIFLSPVKKKAAIIFILSLSIFIIIPNPLMKRIIHAGKEDIYAYTRISIWKSAFSMFKEHPISGVGIGNFRYSTYRYAFPVEGNWARYAKVAHYAHNELFQLGAEMGIIGMLFFLGGFGMLFWMGFHPDNFHSSGDKKALLVGISVLFIHSMVDFIFHIPPLIFMLIILAVWMRQIYLSDREGKGYRGELSVSLPQWVCLILLIVPLFIIVILIRQYLGFFYFSKAKGKDLMADVRLIEKAVRMDFSCAPYHNSLGGAYFGLYGLTHDPAILEKGIREAELAQALNPEDYNFPLSLGEGYLNVYHSIPSRKDLLDKASLELRQSLTLAPSLYIGYLELGKALFYQGNLEESIQAFKEVIQLEPYSMDGHYWIGKLFEKQGNEESAYSAYKEVLRIHRLGLEKQAKNPYEKSLIDFDIHLLKQRSDHYRN